MTPSEQISCIALSIMFRTHGRQLLELYRHAGSAAAIVSHADNLQAIVPDLNPQAFLIDETALSEALRRAEGEVEFAQKHDISILTPTDAAYPTRLLNVCPDAPLALFYRGNADLNAVHTLAVVGTRRSTQYGLDMVNAICSDLAAFFPDLLIVSGLAYGTDINAHRAALDNNLPTVGVLAHGLDTIYPALHRNTAARMVNRGGLITEYPTLTRPDGLNFLHRNRIIAGIAEATLVVESRERGGSLTTARLANEYSLTVMACPGRATDQTSVGCNRLIQTNSAALVTSAADIVRTVGWQVPKQAAAPLPSMFDEELNAEERIVFNTLTDEPRHFSYIVSISGLPVPTVLSVLSELEFRGLARQLPGSNWRKL